MTERPPGAAIDARLDDIQSQVSGLSTEVAELRSLLGEHDHLQYVLRSEVEAAFDAHTSDRDAHHPADHTTPPVPPIPPGPEPTPTIEIATDIDEFDRLAREYAGQRTIGLRSFVLPRPLRINGAEHNGLRVVADPDMDGWAWLTCTGRQVPVGVWLSSVLDVDVSGFHVTGAGLTGVGIGGYSGDIGDHAGTGPVVDSRVHDFSVADVGQAGVKIMHHSRNLDIDDVEVSRTGMINPHWGEPCYVGSNGGIGSRNAPVDLTTDIRMRRWYVHDVSAEVDIKPHSHEILLDDWLIEDVTLALRQGHRQYSSAAVIFGSYGPTSRWADLGYQGAGDVHLRNVEVRRVSKLSGGTYHGVPLEDSYWTDQRMYPNGIAAWGGRSLVENCSATGCDRNGFDLRVLWAGERVEVTNCTASGNARNVAVGTVHPDGTLAQTGNTW